jgi:pseudouridine-5'-phosphate glycosidase
MCGRIPARILSLTGQPQAGNPLITLSEEVEDAVINGKPIVALETAIVTHGMPFPANLKTAMSVESCVRESGAIPATIGSEFLGTTSFQL